MTVTHRWSRVVAGAAVSAALIGPALALMPAVAGAEPCPPDVQECVQNPVAPQLDQPYTATEPGAVEQPVAPEMPGGMDRPGSWQETDLGGPVTPAEGTAPQPAAPAWAPDADVVWNPDMSEWGVWMGSVFIPVF